jgi:hypothetical protein
MKNKYIISIVVAIVLVAGVLAVQHLSNNPRSTFERLVLKPIPNSVQFIEQGKFSAMDSTLVVLHFQISKTDLQALLETQHFAPIDEGNEFKRWDQSSKDYVQIQKEDFLKLWKQRIQNSTKLDVNFTSSWQIYTLKEGAGEKYIFSDTSSTEVVFIAETH